MATLTMPRSFATRLLELLKSIMWHHYVNDWYEGQQCAGCGCLKWPEKTKRYPGHTESCPMEKTITELEAELAK